MSSNNSKVSYAIIDKSKYNLVIDKSKNREILERIIRTNPTSNFFWEIVEVEE